jgi:hypothetical protein
MKILVRQMETEHPMCQLLTCALDKIGTDQITRPARTGMQHDPHRIRFVEADFDKVIATAERTELTLNLVGTDLAMLGLDHIQLLDQP